MFRCGTSRRATMAASAAPTSKSLMASATSAVERFAASGRRTGSAKVCGRIRNATGERHRAHRVGESPNGPVGTQSLASSSEFAFSGKLGSVFPSLHCRAALWPLARPSNFMAFSDPDVVASTTKSTPFICNLLQTSTLNSPAITASANRGLC